MNRSQDLDWLGLERLYDEGCRLVLRGRYEEAVDQFKRIYEDTLDLRDVTEVVDDFYDLPRDAWLTKYQARFEM
jgi:hypothetical protein